MLLELGGGTVPAPGHINIDIIPTADIVWDLNEGLPRWEEIENKEVFIKPNSIDGIRCHQVLEHLTDIIPVLNDCYEVMKEGALFEISVPHKDHWEAWADPTHKRYFVEQSFQYFVKDSPFAKEQEEYGITARFSIVTLRKEGWMIQVVLQK